MSVCTLLTCRTAIERETVPGHTIQDECIDQDERALDAASCLVREDMMRRRWMPWRWVPTKDVATLR